MCVCVLFFLTKDLGINCRIYGNSQLFAKWLCQFAFTWANTRVLVALHSFQHLALWKVFYFPPNFIHLKHFNVLVVEVEQSWILHLIC